MSLKTYACLITITMLISVGFCLVPAISDDLAYAMPFQEFLPGRSDFSFSMIAEGISSHYLYDNARLCNVVMVCMMPLPRFVPIVGSFCLLLYLFVLGSHYAKMQHNNVLVALFVTYIIVCFPWTDQMYLVDFQHNYLWSVALSLLVVVALQRQRRVKMWQLALLSLVTGAWHEGYSFPLLIMILVVAVTHRHMRTSKTFVMAASLAVGFAYICSSPVFTGSPNRYFSARMIMIYPYVIPTLVFAIFAVYRRKTLSLRVIALLVPAIVSAAMMLYTQQGARVGALSVVFSGVGLFMMMPRPRTSHRLAAMVYAIVVLHLIAVDVQAYKAKIDTEKVLAEYAIHPTETIFSDMVLRENAPWYCLQKPYYGWFAHESTLRIIEQFYGYGVQLCVVPKILADFEPCDKERIDGNIEIYYHCGLLVMPAIVEFRGVGTFDVDYGNGARRRSYMVMPFTSQCNGQRYLWVYPENTWLDQALSPRPVTFNDY